MKWTTMSRNIGKAGQFGRRMGAVGRAFALMAVCTLCFFIVFGLAGFLQSRMTTSPVSSMKGIAAAVSSQFFMDMMAMEVAHMNRDVKASTFSPKNVSGFVFQFLTSINPLDPKSFIAREVPLMGSDSAILLHKGSGTNTSVYPQDYHPPADSLKPHRPSQPNGGTADGGKGAPSGTDGGAPNGTDGGTLSGTDGGKSPEPGSGSANPQSPPGNETPGGTQAGKQPEKKKVVFIYHSHNRESWYPELKTKKKDANDAEINVTLLGKRMAEKLEGLGIGAVHSGKDYATEIKGYNWNFSYKYSSATVKEAFAVNPDLQYFIDIHRDSQGRSKTTATINGKTYAQVYFIIGHGNPNWRKNDDFAKQISDELDKRYPGLSRGIFGKNKSSGHGEYNQSISPHSILIEIGGVDNTLEECYRTVDVLAQVVAEIYRQAEKVNAPADTLVKKTS